MAKRSRTTRASADGRSAVTVSTAAPPSTLVQALAANNPASSSAGPGIGKKRRSLADSIADKGKKVRLGPDPIAPSTVRFVSAPQHARCEWGKCPFTQDLYFATTKQYTINE